MSGPDDFCWATGIEDTFVPQARPGMRALDEYELTQHYQQWEHDFSLAASLGVRALRWGIPWYRVEPEPGRFDWEWTDRAIEALVERYRLVPILDLVHYGTPLWLDNSFINAYYPERVADYAAAVARRYGGMVKVYTPLNEPMMSAEMSGLRGQWPPYLEGEDGYIKMVMALARGMALTAQAIRAEAPDATLVQVEALWRHETASEDPAHQARVARGNARQYLGFDLASGLVGQGHELLDYLLAGGAREADLEWLRARPARFDVVGANFYPWSYSRLAPDGQGGLARLDIRTPGAVIGDIVRDAWQRYRLPVMITETATSEPLEGRLLWMEETIQASWALRAEGVPLVGYTWFPMMTMVDWLYRMEGAPLEEYLIHLGLFDSHLDAEGILRRAPTPLVARFQEAVGQPVPPLGPRP